MNVRETEPADLVDLTITRARDGFTLKGRDCSTHMRLEGDGSMPLRLRSQTITQASCLGLLDKVQLWVDPMGKIQLEARADNGPAAYRINGIFQKGQPKRLYDQNFLGAWKGTIFDKTPFTLTLQGDSGRVEYAYEPNSGTCRATLRRAFVEEYARLYELTPEPGSACPAKKGTLVEIRSSAESGAADALAYREFGAGKVWGKASGR